MSSLARRMSPLLSRVLTSPRTRSARRAVAEIRRRASGAPHRVLYFHQVDDPYSHLAAQVLSQLCRVYAIELEPHLVGPPPDAAAPERALLEAFARRDAADVAPGHGLDFPHRDDPPEEKHVALAAKLLAAANAAGRFVELAAPIGAAMWRGDGAGLEALADELPQADASRAEAAILAGTVLREERGHYLGAMFHYGGEWYWGVDRLVHLERRLRALSALRSGADSGWVAPRPEGVTAASGPLGPERLTLEYFPSLRSPYTHVAMERVLGLSSRLPVDLVLRPVLPMVMRGLPVPRAKRTYIMLDAKREAELAGVDFGHVCDPVGRPVERAFSLFAWARDRGRGGEFLHAFTRAAFAEGVDTGTDAGLRGVVERAGLSWSDALPHLDRDGWQAELEENRRVLFAAGLWGVPSFRLLGRGPDEPDYATWGQDRIWRVEQEILRRAARD